MCVDWLVRWRFKVRTVVVQTALEAEYLEQKSSIQGNLSRKNLQRCFLLSGCLSLTCPKNVELYEIQELFW